MVFPGKMPKILQILSREDGSDGRITTLTRSNILTDICLNHFYSSDIQNIRKETKNDGLSNVFSVFIPKYSINSYCFLLITDSKQIK